LPGSNNRASADSCRLGCWGEEPATKARGETQGDQAGREQAEAGPHGTTTSPAADSPTDVSDV
jgi:hypothetical protein